MYEKPKPAFKDGRSIQVSEWEEVEETHGESSTRDSELVWQRQCRNENQHCISERVKHVVQSAFDGRRIVIFSGGAKSEDQNVFEEARAIRDGGGFGSIIGRNSFQRPKAEAVKFLQTIIGIYAGEIL